MAAPAAAPGGDNPYGIVAALQQGGIIAQITFGIMVIMSIGSWYIFFVKLIEQQKIIKEGRRARTAFWQSPNLREGANKLDKNGAYRQIVDDGLEHRPADRCRTARCRRTTSSSAPSGGRGRS